MAAPDRPSGLDHLLQGNNSSMSVVLLTDVVTLPVSASPCTGFEDWCWINRIHPEHPGAWDLFQIVCEAA